MKKDAKRVTHKMRASDSRSRLVKLCREKNDAAKLEAERQATEQVTRLPLVSIISRHDELAEQIDLITRAFYRGFGTAYEDNYDFTLTVLGEDTFWPQLTQVLQNRRASPTGCAAAFCNNIAWCLMPGANVANLRTKST